LRAREGFVLDGRERGGTIAANGRGGVAMRDIDLFQLALGLVPPWMVADANPTSRIRPSLKDFSLAKSLMCKGAGSRKSLDWAVVQT
jgi:hypothetical protein